MSARHLALGALLVVLATAGCSRQESAWKSSHAEDNVAAYQAYLHDYPNGAHATEARARLAQLEEQAEWDRAQQFNTPEAYQRYLSGYPAGRYATEAREKLSGFLLTQAGIGQGAATAAAGGTTAAPPATAAAPPPAATPPVAAPAVKPLARSPAPPPVQAPARTAARAQGERHARPAVAPASHGGYRVQLGAFGRGESAARSAWQTLVRRHHAELGSLKPHIDVIQRGGHKLWRLQAGPLSQARAAAVCKALKAHGTACLVVRG